MATTSKLRWTNTVRDSYLERVMQFPLVTIQSDAHLKEAQQVIDALLAEGTLDRGEELYLDTLSDLVVTYEDEHHAIPAASDARVFPSGLNLTV
jgi:HTH-type transcriptional regulator/antitoxin HigA